MPSSATTLAPSVDGFRQSSKTGKAALTAKTEVKKTGKVSEELLYCVVGVIRLLGACGDHFGILTYLHVG